MRLFSLLAVFTVLMVSSACQVDEVKQAESALIGEWEPATGMSDLVLVFTEDGGLIAPGSDGPERGEYTVVDGGQLRLVGPEGEEVMVDYFLAPSGRLHLGPFGEGALKRVGQETATLKQTARVGERWNGIDETVDHSLFLYREGLYEVAVHHEGVENVEDLYWVGGRYFAPDSLILGEVTLHISREGDELFLVEPISGAERLTFERAR